MLVDRHKPVPTCSETPFVSDCRGSLLTDGLLQAACAAAAALAAAGPALLLLPAPAGKPVCDDRMPDRTLAFSTFALLLLLPLAATAALALGGLTADVADCSTGDAAAALSA
jgi:hypothetical protein